MKSQPITLALNDSSRGYEISPNRVPASVLADFSKDVSSFIGGAARGEAGKVEVSIEEGSLALVARPHPSESIYHDLQILQSSKDLSKIDRKRKEIIEKWQEKAKQIKGYSVRLRSKTLDHDLVFNSTSNYESLITGQLVRVERYIRGEILDLGGAFSTTANVQTPDGGKIKMKVSKELIQSESINRVYKESYMRIRGNLNIETNELSDVELISFIEYKPSFDEKSMSKLIANGRKAWADIEDPAAWINSMRGGHN